MAAKQSGGGWKWVVLFLILVAGIAGAVWYFKFAHDDLPQYETVSVVRGDLTQTVTATGA
jgi:hypothetical protein